MSTKMKKRSLTLIEIIIGFVLSAILIGGLFEIQRQFGILQTKVEKTKDIVFERERFHTKLSQIVRHVTDCWVDAKGCLVLQYTQLLDHDRDFRGECLALLHKDGESLILTTYGKKIRQDVLLKLDKKATVSYLFFDEQTAQWIDHPPKDLFKPDKNTHSLIKIMVTGVKQNDTIEFPFWINS